MRERVLIGRPPPPPPPPLLILLLLLAAEAALPSITGRLDDDDPWRRSMLLLPPPRARVPVKDAPRAPEDSAAGPVLVLLRSGGGAWRAPTPAGPAAEPVDGAARPPPSGRGAPMLPALVLALPALPRCLSGGPPTARARCCCCA